LAAMKFAPPLPSSTRAVTDPVERLTDRAWYQDGCAIEHVQASNMKQWTFPA